LDAALDRLERDPAIALEELARPGGEAGIVEALIVEVAVHPVEPRGRPAATPFEEPHPPLPKALPDPPPEPPHSGEQHPHRVRDYVLRAAAFKAVDPDGRHVEARTLVNADRHVELFGGIPERLIIRVVEHLVVVWIGPDEGGAEAELLARKVHLLDRQL